MIYQMLTGELPHGMFKLPSQMLPEIDERFDAIICKALESKPEDRHQSAAEMRDDLAAICVTPAQAVGALIKKRAVQAWLCAAVSIAVLAVAGLIVMGMKSRSPAEDRALQIQQIKVLETTGAADAVPVLPWQRVDLSSVKGLKADGGRYRCTSYLLLEDVIKIRAKNIAVKVMAAPAVGNFPLAIMLRTAPGGQRYQGVIQTEAIHGGISYWQASRASPEPLRASTADRAAADGLTEHVLEFRAIEGNLTLLQDGVEVAGATHALLKEGGIAIQIGEGGSLSRIEYAVLDSLSPHE